MIELKGAEGLTWQQVHDIEMLIHVMIEENELDLGNEQSTAMIAEIKKKYE